MAQRHQNKYARHINDFYETPEWITEVLIQEMGFRPPAFTMMLDPCAGNHKIVNVFKKHGVNTMTNDIVEYGHPNNWNEDFLSPESEETELGWAIQDVVVMNPPYGHAGRLARQFVEQALRVNRHWVAALLTATFDSGSSRRHLFADNPRFSQKIVLLDRPSWLDNGTAGSVDFAWFIWRPEVGTTNMNPIITYRENPEKRRMRLMKKSR